jgi:hypothetical protein
MKNSQKTAVRWVQITSMPVRALRLTEIERRRKHLAESPNHINARPAILILEQKALPITGLIARNMLMCPKAFHLEVIYA